MKVVLQLRYVASINNNFTAMRTGLKEAIQLQRRANEGSNSIVRVRWVDQWCRVNSDELDRVPGSAAARFSAKLRNGTTIYPLC